jgi:RNA polymerase sigma factor (sigma-70 family)
MPDVSDIELLRDYARDAAEDAFAELVCRHINLVYSAAIRHVGIAAQAEEITQAVFVILARKAATLRPDMVLDAWLYQTTRLISLSFLRGERRRQLREKEAYIQSVIQEPNDAAMWSQLAPLLDEAMERLGNKDREAVVLRFFKDKSVYEVAVALKITEAAAQSRVHRAVEKLQKFFFKRGVTSTTAAIARAISANSVQAAPAVLAKTTTVVALAKGTTASISTLILIKGALKIMAWTKAKTAIVVGAAAILVVGTATTLIAHRAHQAGLSTDMAALQGTWTGQETGGGPGLPMLKVDGAKLEFSGSNPNEWYKATFSLSEDKVPKQLVAVVTDCAAAQYVGKTSYAIYEIKDGMFSMTANEPGKPQAPSSFDNPKARKFVFTKK